MITIHLENTSPLVDVEGLAIKKDCISLVKQQPVFEGYCECACEYNELVFAKVGGEAYENDKTSLLFAKLISTDSIVMKLYKDGLLVDILNANTYGTYYHSFTANALYVGYLIEWEKVFDLEGGGEYQVKIEKTILGQLTEIWTHKYSLREFSVEKAHDTVMIETWQTGNIISSEFDYTGLLPSGWYASQRIRGRFGNKTPKITVDNYMNKDYKLLQIQDKITNEWSFETELIPISASSLLIYDQLLANTIRISDYNIYSEEVNYNIEVSVSEISEKKMYSKNKNSKFLIKFTDRLLNIIKHN
jgi:hypothetical protein